MRDIDRYLDGELSGEKILKFEAHCENCPACAKELALAKKIRRVIKSMPKENLRPGFAERVAKRINRKRVAVPLPKKVKFTILPLGAAASVVLGLLFLLESPVKKITTQEPYAEKTVSDVSDKSADSVAVNPELKKAVTENVFSKVKDNNQNKTPSAPKKEKAQSKPDNSSAYRKAESDDSDRDRTKISAGTLSGFSEVQPVSPQDAPRKIRSASAEEPSAAKSVDKDEQVYFSREEVSGNRPDSESKKELKAAAVQSESSNVEKIQSLIVRSGGEIYKTEKTPDGRTVFYVRIRADKVDSLVQTLTRSGRVTLTGASTMKASSGYASDIRVETNE